MVGLQLFLWLFTFFPQKCQTLSGKHCRIRRFHHFRDKYEFARPFSNLNSKVVQKQNPEAKRSSKFVPMLEMMESSNESSNAAMFS